MMSDTQPVDRDFAADTDLSVDVRVPGERAGGKYAILEILPLGFERDKPGPGTARLAETSTLNPEP